MTPLASSLVDWSALGQVALISAGTGLGIGLALVLAVLSSLRAQSDRAAGNNAAALSLGAVTAISLLFVLAAIAVGLYFIAAK